MYRLKINPRKVTNGRDLPREPEEGLLFYELVVTQHDYSHPVLRVPFHPNVDDDITITLWHDSVEVPEELALRESMSGRVGRWTFYPLEIHFYKVVTDVDEDDYDERIERIGFERHIQEGTSVVQDVPSFVINSHDDMPPPRKYMSEFTFTDAASLTPLRPLTEVKLDKSDWGSQSWLTQREFYSTSGVTSSHPVHRENLDRAINKFLVRYRDKTFPSLCDMLVEYGKVMKMGRMRYKSDTKFATTGVPSDAGDALVELTTKGDCEDFAHFYMRNIRMLAKIFKYVLDKSSDLYSKCEMLANEYVAFNYICRVQLSHGPEFHSTMLVVPRTEQHPMISFEVTDPEKSYTLPSKEFDEWHDQHYFLLEPICIHRLNRKEKPRSPSDISKLTVQTLFPYNY